MKVVVLGAGESGIGAALLAKQLGYEIFVSDKGSIKEKYKQELVENNIPFEEGNHSEKKIFEASVIIKSPGIPDKIELIRRLNEKGLEVISEIEFASRFTSAKIIGITGSNGKTTTTNLTYHLLKTGGLHVAMGGNVGYSFARLLTESQCDLYVLELSSFQLDGIKNFKPDIAMLLNITPDHLDRYDYQLENYIASKFRIIMNQGIKDTFIYNADNGNMQSFLKNQNLIMQTVPVKEQTSAKPLIKVRQINFDLSGSALKGRHNRFNAICAIEAALLCGVEESDIRKGLQSFANDAHRLESIAVKQGVEYINDSKATNVDAVYYALDAMTKPIVWIVGGTDKGNDYGSLIKLVEEKVKAIICLGADNSKILEVFSPLIKNIEETSSAKEAVKRAGIYAEKGDVVILSPACASFDLFKNYEDRGDQFRTAVLNIDD